MSLSREHVIVRIENEVRRIGKNHIQILERLRQYKGVHPGRMQLADVVKALSDELPIHKLMLDPQQHTPVFVRHSANILHPSKTAWHSYVVIDAIHNLNET